MTRASDIEVILQLAELPPNETVEGMRIKLARLRAGPLRLERRRFEINAYHCLTMFEGLGEHRKKFEDETREMGEICAKAMDEKLAFEKRVLAWMKTAEGELSIARQREQEKRSA